LLLLLLLRSPEDDLDDTNANHAALWLPWHFLLLFQTQTAADPNSIVMTMLRLLRKVSLATPAGHQPEP